MNEYLPCIFGAIVAMIATYFMPYRKVYCNDEGWQPIETMPEDIENKVESILLTDGVGVREIGTPKFNRRGKCLYPYTDRLATHWRRLPRPPLSKGATIEK